MKRKSFGAVSYGIERLVINTTTGYAKEREEYPSIQDDNNDVSDVERKWPEPERRCSK